MIAFGLVRTIVNMLVFALVASLGIASGARALEPETALRQNSPSPDERARGFGPQALEMRRENRAVTTKVASECCDPARGAGFFDDFARAATRNPDGSTVVLGKFAEGGVSYVKVAAHFKASYFKVVDWANATRGLSQGEIWKINEAFLRQQIQTGKQVILSHNPATATGFFAKEVGYLEALGYRFVQEGWFWRAVR